MRQLHINVLTNPSASPTATGAHEFDGAGLRLTGPTDTIGVVRSSGSVKMRCSSRKGRYFSLTGERLGGLMSRNNH